eukprot:gene5328-7232_t
MQSSQQLSAKLERTTSDLQEAQVREASCREQLAKWLEEKKVMRFELLQAKEQHSEQLLRIKGLINVAGTMRPQIIQCVQDVAYPSVTLQAWPKEGPFRDGCSRLVFIARDLGPAHIEAIGAALAQLPTDAIALRMSSGDSM